MFPCPKHRGLRKQVGSSGSLLPLRQGGFREDPAGGKWLLTPCKATFSRGCVVLLSAVSTLGV